MSEDLLVLREILQRELETINAYERMLSRIGDPALRKIIEHVTDEEREHVSEMYQLIMQRDSVQAERAEKSRTHLIGMALLPGEGQPAAAVASAGLGGELIITNPRDAAAMHNSATPTIFPDGDWSVGPLKGRSP
jgi:ferritin-like metal-binding protein YciE